MNIFVIYVLCSLQLLQISLAFPLMLHKDDIFVSKEVHQRHSENDNYTVFSKWPTLMNKILKTWNLSNSSKVSFPKNWNIDSSEFISKDDDLIRQKKKVKSESLITLQGRGDEKPKNAFISIESPALEKQKNKNVEDEETPIELDMGSFYDEKSSELPVKLGTKILNGIKMSSPFSINVDIIDPQPKSDTLNPQKIYLDLLQDKEEDDYDFLFSSQQITTTERQQKIVEPEMDTIIERDNIYDFVEKDILKTTAHHWPLKKKCNPSQNTHSKIYIDLMGDDFKRSNDAIISSRFYSSSDDPCVSTTPQPDLILDDKETTEYYEEELETSTTEFLTTTEEEEVVEGQDEDYPENYKENEESPPTTTTKNALTTPKDKETTEYYEEELETSTGELSTTTEEEKVVVEQDEDYPENDKESEESPERFYKEEKTIPTPTPNTTNNALTTLKAKERYEMYDSVEPDYIDVDEDGHRYLLDDYREYALRRALSHNRFIHHVNPHIIVHK